MKILIIATAYNRDYDCQALMYEYFASKPDTEVWAIAPLFTDTTRGQIEARRDEKSNGVRIKRIYKNIPEMWNVPFAAQKELDQICRDFKPDIIWCWHEGNYPIASYIHAKTNAPIVLYLECPGNKIVETAKKDKVPIILSCVRIHKLFEKDMTRDGFYFLQVSAPAGVPDASSYWQKEKNNRGIFCGSLGYEYKWPKYFMELLPQLFEKTSMESFFLLSSGSKYPSDIMSTIGKKFPITYVPHLTRREIFQEIAKSKFGFITMKGPWPGAFPGECWALKTPLLSAGGTLGGCIEDLVSGVRSIESLNHIYNDGNVYKAIQEEGYKRYDEEYSTEAVGERCYKVFQGIIDNNLKDVWESLRFKGYENEIACAANMSKEDFYRRRECDVEFAGQSPKALLDEWQNKLNAKVVQENALIMGDKILDLGCGSGALSAVIAKNGAHVTGVDIQDKAKDYFNRIKELLPDDIKERMSFCQTCFPKLDIPDFSHTGAYLLDILEHLIQDDAYNLLKELNRVLDINGHIIICVPNGDEFDIYNGLNGNKPIHITSYTMKSLSDLVVKAGFRIKNAFYDRRADDDNKWNHNRIYILAQKDNRIAQQCGNPGTAVPGRKLKIAIQLPVVNTFGRAVWGDEVMAVGMAQALTRLSEVEKVEIHDPVTIHDNFDIIINYYLHPQTRFVSGPFNIWWYQAPIFSQYTLENMPAILSLYDGFMCASPDLAKFLKKFNRESMIFTMSSNEEYYHRVPSSDNFKADIVFCANNNRSLEDIKNYLIPLVPLGLKIYGSGWEKVPELKDAIKGPIHPKDVPALYSSAKLILSVHTKWHRENNVPTSRLWEASACRAPVISDKLPLAYELFGDSLIWTSGREDIVEKVKYYLQNEKELKEKAEKAYKITIEHGSFDKQVPKILELYHNNFSSARINPVVEKKKGVTNLDVEQVLNKRGQHLNEFMLVNSYDMKINDCFINEEIDKWIADYYAGNTESIFNLLKNNPLYLKYIMKERNIKLISSYVKIVQEEAEILKTKESINPGILNITNDAGETSILLSPFFKISNVSVPGIIQKFVEFNIKKISNDIEILNEFPAGRKYNIINAINVFEFLENPWEAIFKIYNLLEDGGILITNGLWFDPLEQISNEISCIYQHNDNFIMVMDVLGFFLEKNYSSDNFQIGIFSKGRSKGYASALKLIKEFSESENGHCAREKYRTNFITQAKHSIEQKKNKKAIVLLIKALNIKKTKKAADIYNLLGECYYNKESYKKSEEYFLKALSIQNTNTQVLCNLGVLNWMQGKNKEAVNFFQQALKINPDHKDSLANLVIVNYNEKNIASCINYAERFLEKYPNDEEICFYLQNSLAQVQNNEPGITKAL